MGPGLLSGIYRPEEARFHIKKLVEDRGASFVKGYVTRINADKRFLVLESGEEVPYDVVSFNTGSGVPLDEVNDDKNNVYPVKPIVNLLKARKIILDKIRGEIPRLLVVGGGPAGVELSGNLWRLVHDNGGQAEITLIAGGSLLSFLPGKARSLAIASLRKRGIEVVEGAQVKRFADGEAVLADGRRLPYDIVFAALGVKPSQIFRESGLPTGNDGGLLVNEYLQSVAHPEIFGGGDCISLQGSHLDKVGVYAVRQNEILHHNLLSALSGGAMERFTPQRNVPAHFQSWRRYWNLCKKIMGLERQASFSLQGLPGSLFYAKIPGLRRAGGSVLKYSIDGGSGLHVTSPWHQCFKHFHASLYLSRMCVGIS